jgi:hypothetical protein
MSDLMDLYRQAAVQDPRLQGNQPEMRSYSPSMGERVTGWLNDIGASTGYYPDLGTRTNDTLSLLGMASMFAPLGMPARAAAAGSGPAWDASMAKVLNRKYPDSPAVAGGAKDYWRSSQGLAREDGMRSAALPSNQMSNGIVRETDLSMPGIGNDQPPVSGDSLRYLNELLAQQARSGFRTVR